MKTSWYLRFLDRSECHSFLGNSGPAISDAQTAHELTKQGRQIKMSSETRVLVVSPQILEGYKIRATLLLAEAHFVATDFERAAVWYHRFLRYYYITRSIEGNY